MNVFQDQRFGENDASITEEERNLIRFRKERERRLNKKSLYNLDDNLVLPESEEYVLTHKGTALSK